jgi:hypothetical protein
LLEFTLSQNIDHHRSVFNFSLKFSNNHLQLIHPTAGAV